MHMSQTNNAIPELLFSLTSAVNMKKFMHFIFNNAFNTEFCNELAALLYYWL